MLDRRSAILLFSALVAGCSHDATSPVLSCKSAPPQVLLTVGQYTSLDQACVAFPANASTDSTEYLVVAQSAGGTGASAAFELRANVAPGMSVQAPVRSAFQSSRPGGALAAQFDRYLRELARKPAVVPPGASVRALAAPPASAAPVIPQIGDTRTFPHVCSNIGCTTWKSVTADVKAVSGHVAIYVDPQRAGDLTQADIDSLALVFDQHVYNVDTTAFGREPDFDNNGVVIVLLSGLVNGLTTDPSTCFTTGYVAGYFFSPDLDVQVANSYNGGEIMYGLVADVNGTFSCPHTIAAVKRLLPETFLHELEHMISYNQHVRLRRVPAPIPEDIWLDEALANYAEELGGRSFLPGDSASFKKYTLDDLNDAYMYLTDPQNHFLLTSNEANLSDNGAGWLFIRYLVDQSGPSITRALINTSLTGTNNIQTQSHVPFETSVSLWSLANWASDLPGFTPLPELRYTSWSLRNAFDSLHAQDSVRYPVRFPLAPTVSAGAQVSIAGTLRGGTGYYVRVVQPPSTASFTLLFTGPFSAPLPATIKPRLVFLRLR